MTEHLKEIITNPFVPKFAPLLKKYKRVLDTNKLPGLRTDPKKISLYLAPTALICMGIVPVTLGFETMESLPTALSMTLWLLPSVIFLAAILGALLWEELQFRKMDSEMSQADREWIATVLRDFHKMRIWGGEKSVLSNSMLRHYLVHKLTSKAFDILSDKPSDRVSTLRYIFVESDYEHFKLYNFTRDIHDCIDYGLEKMSESEVRKRLDSLDKLENFS